MAKSKDAHFIQNIGLKKGALRRTLGTPKGKDIPMTLLRAAAKGKGVRKITEKRAQLAITLKKLGKRRKGKSSKK